jgi:hypothetical protein
MVKRASILVLSAAVGVGLAIGAVSLSAANPDDSSKVTRAVTFATFTVGIPGTVNSVARPNRIIGILVSLHSLEPNTSYELSGNRKPCSVADAVDYVLWRKAFQTQSNDDVFAKTKTDRELRGNARSVRLTIPSGTGDDEVACTSAFAYIKFDEADGGG